MTLRRSLAAMGLALALAAPHALAAEWKTVAAFSGPSVDNQWRINGPKEAVSTVEGGVRIVASAPVTIFRELKLAHPVDTIVIDASAAATLQATLLWHERGTPDDRIVQLPFTIPATGTVTRVPVAVLNYPVWDRYADALGISFPPGSDVTIADVQFVGLPWYERFGNAIKTLFVFDKFTRHSINFVWGPLLAFDADTRSMLYESSPPMAWSVNRVLLPALAVALIAFWGLAFAGKISRRAALLAGISVVAGTWLLFDLRMGAEIFSYVRNDLTSYVLKPEGERRLRGMADFHDTMQSFLNLTKDKERIGFISDGDLLLDSSAVYEAYPRWVALPGEPQDGIDTWLVYYRSDVTISPEGQLLIGSKPVSPPGGRVLLGLSPHAAIFTTAP